MTVEYSRLDSLRGEAAYIKLIIERTLLIIAASKERECRIQAAI